MPRHPDALPQQEDELRFPELKQRLWEHGYLVTRPVLQVAARERHIPSRIFGNYCRLVPWPEALAWAAGRFPRIAVTETTSVFEIGDEAGMRRHISELHAAAADAAGQDGVIMLATHRSDPREWEPSGICYEPFWPGEIDGMMAAIRDAVEQETDPIILPAIFRGSLPSLVIGASVYTSRPDILLVLPITPRSLILHENDVLEATYLFAEPEPLDRRAKEFGRTLTKLTGGAVFPSY